MTCLKKTALLVAVVAFPSVAIAGGYGSAGVKDATVGQSPTRTATVWCPKLKTQVPIALQQQMDCGEGVAVGTAQPAVARERFGGRGLFGLPPHQPSGPRSALDDNDDTPKRVANNPPRPTEDDDDDTPRQPPTGNDDDEPNDPGSKFTSKDQRLNELGITWDTITDQPKSFHDAFEDYWSKNGADSDWSGFNPPSE